VPKWGAALEVDDRGRPLRFLMDADGSNVAFISSVREDADGRLFFGNVRQNYVSYLEPGAA
jgi:hypothetical protein